MLAEKITDAELEVMKILWKENKPVSFTEIRNELQVKTEWEKSTINTLVRRLADKGVINCIRKKVLLYTPNITEDDYLHSREQYMFNKLHGGSAKNFVASLCRRGKLTEEDIDELKEYFRTGDGL